MSFVVLSVWLEHNSLGLDFHSNLGKVRSIIAISLSQDSSPESRFCSALPQVPLIFPLHLVDSPLHAGGEVTPT